MRLISFCLGFAALAAFALVSPGVQAFASGSMQSAEPAIEATLASDLGALSTALLVAGVAILLATAIWWIDRTSRRQRSDFDNRNPGYFPDVRGGAFRPFDPG